MRDLIKYSGSWEGFRPSADEAARVVRMRLANETKREGHLPRWMLPFACCFAIGVWLAVIFMIVAPGPSIQFVRWSEAIIAHWSGPVKTIVQRHEPAKASAPMKSSTLPNCKEAPAEEGHHGYAARPDRHPCSALPRRFRYSLR